MSENARYKHHATYGDQCAHCVEEEIRDDVEEQVATLTADRDRLREECGRLDALHARIVDIADDILGMQPVVTDRVALLDAIETAYHRERIDRSNADARLASLATAARALLKRAFARCTGLGVACDEPATHTAMTEGGDGVQLCSRCIRGALSNATIVADSVRERPWAPEATALLSQLSALGDAAGEKASASAWFCPQCKTHYDGTSNVCPNCANQAERVGDGNAKAYAAGEKASDDVPNEARK